jgi:hypothetical protein
MGKFVTMVRANSLKTFDSCRSVAIYMPVLCDSRKDQAASMSDARPERFPRSYTRGVSEKISMPWNPKGEVRVTTIGPERVLRPCASRWELSRQAHGPHTLPGTRPRQKGTRRFAAGTTRRFYAGPGDSSSTLVPTRSRTTRLGPDVSVPAILDVAELTNGTFESGS